MNALFKFLPRCSVEVFVVIGTGIIYNTVDATATSCYIVNDAFDFVSVV